MSTISISSAFDAGSINVLSAASAQDIQVQIRADNASEFAQWFYFRVHGVQGETLRVTFNDMKKTAYPDGWKNYQACASYNRRDWFRVPTTFDGDKMVIEMEADCDAIWFAYFEPYSYERHLELLAWANESRHVQLHQLGLTGDGRDMAMLEITDANSAIEKANKKKIWITARQHPGETMAEWFVEGLLERLLDANDAVARVLLQKCVFYVVPNMNPDGAYRGNLRTNAVGANLNREWQTPTVERSPEVFYVRAKMLELGVDMLLDAHGDENLPYNFVAGCEGNPGYNERVASLESAFKSAWLSISPDFQTEFGYEKDQFGAANLTLAANWVGQQFDCLSYTIEMPFKDNANLPDAECGWSGERSRQFGASVLQPMLMVADKLR